MVVFLLRRNDRCLTTLFWESSAVFSTPYILRDAPEAVDCSCMVHVCAHTHIVCVRLSVCVHAYVCMLGQSCAEAHCAYSIVLRI